jgi:hypothetical protein
MRTIHSAAIAKRTIWLTAAAIGAIPTISPAATSSWTFAGSGNWTVNSNWAGGTPIAASDAVISHNDAINRTIGYDYGGASIQLNTMTVNNSGTGSEIFSQGGKVLNVFDETIGSNGFGYWTLNGTGIQNVNANLILGSASAGRGVGTLSGGSLTVNDGSMYLGFDGIGTMTQSAGTYTGTSSTIILGNDVLAAGTYVQTGGALSSAAEYVGTSGTGNLIVSGGTHALGTMYVGYLANSNGTASLSNTGSLTVTGLEFVGLFGSGTFIQSGGSHSAGSISVGNNLTGIGTFMLSAGTLSSGDIAVGEFGSGEFDQSGGTSTIGAALSPHTLEVGVNPGAVGTYSLSAGTLTCFGDQYVGTQGTALFNQSGGTNTIGTLSAQHFLQVGFFAGGSGTYILGSGAVLTDNGTESIGSSGAGVFLQSGGTNTVGTLEFSKFGGSAIYLLGGGTLNASTINVMNNTTFSFSGGTMHGTMNVTSGTFITSGSVQTDATINLNVPAQVFVNGTLLASGLVTDFGAIINGTGTFATSSTGILRGSGKLNCGALNNSGTLLGDTGALTISSPILQNFGTLENNSGASLFVKSTSLTNSGNIVVNGGGAVNFDVDLSNPTGHSITLIGGTLATPNLTNASGATINGFGQITANLGNKGSISFIGPTQVVGTFDNQLGAVVNVRNAQTLVTGLADNHGTITTSNGTIIFDAGLIPSAPLGTGGLDGDGTLTVSPGGHVITSYVRQQTLSITGVSGNTGFGTIRSRAEGGSVSIVQSLNISGAPGAFTGMLDLADTDLIASATPIANIASFTTSGYAGGSWTGTGLTSSAAAAIAADGMNPHKTALGYATAAGVGIGTFDGQSVGGTTSLVRYTFSGDANIDGKVNALDFNALATNFGTGGGEFWFQGDFNYDGSVNTSDFTTLAQNFGQVLSSPSLSAVVPEPIAQMTVVITAVSYLVRRRSVATQCRQ